MNPPLLNDAAIGQLTALAVGASLYDDPALRDTFFVDVRAFSFTLPRLDSPLDQARSDLAKMAEVRAQPGAPVPLVAWLGAVSRYLTSQGRPEGAVFGQHLVDVQARLRAEVAAAAPVASQRPHGFEHDLLVLHAGTEGDAARQLQALLPGRRLRFEDRALAPRDTDGWRYLEALARRSQATVVWLGPAALGFMAERRDRVHAALDLLDGLTGTVVGVLPQPTPAAVEAARALWPFRAMAPPQRVAEALPPPLPSRAVGLPFIVIAPTADEVAELLRDPSPAEALGPAKRAELAALRQAVLDTGGELARRYGKNRLTHLNQQGAGRALVAQHYPFEPLVRADAERLPLYDELARSGCVVLLDELALFHPTLRRAFLSVPFQHSPNAALITVRPMDANRHPALRPVSEAALDALAHAVYRFQTTLDPHCELGVGSAVWFDRWLHTALPDVVETLRESRADPNRLRRFLEDEGLDGGGMDLTRVLYFDRE